jgi:hypothetical protein
MAPLAKEFCSETMGARAAGYYADAPAKARAVADEAGEDDDDDVFDEDEDDLEGLGPRPKVEPIDPLEAEAESTPAPWRLTRAEIEYLDALGIDLEQGYNRNLERLMEVLFAQRFVLRQSVNAALWPSRDLIDGVITKLQDFLWARVVSVAADRFVVEMHAGTDNFTVVGFDGVHYVARLGSFLMIPAQSEYVVVEVIGLRERDASSPSDRGDFDRAGSSKYLDVVPVGMLPMRGGSFRFGVSVFPSLYADALYALDDELDRVFETESTVETSVGLDGGACTPAGATRYRVLPIGRSVVFEDYDVKVRLDDFFGGHVAVLGNTGSGKSCTVAAVLQSLFEKTDEHHARGATFIIFDVNGEYQEALTPLAKPGGIGVKRVVLDAATGGFRMPHWFLEMAEWELLLQASEKTQLPVLRTALGLTSLFHAKTPEALALREHFVATCIVECFRGADGDSPVSKFQRVVSLLQKYPTAGLDMALLNRFGPNTQYGNFTVPNGQANFLAEVRKKLREDVPLPAYTRTPFSFDELHECLDFAILYEEAHGNRQIRDYCSSLVTRLKSLQERVEYSFLRHEGADVGAAPDELTFLAGLVGLGPKGDRYEKQDQIIIIDLNAVEDEVVELVSAVIARMLFRLLRRADPRPKSDDTKVVDLWFHEEGRPADIRLTPPVADEDEVEIEIEIEIDAVEDEAAEGLNDVFG